VRWLGILAAAAAGLVVVLGVVLVVATPPVDPVAWTAPPAPSLAEGPYALNDRLRGIRRIAEAVGHGPESVAVGPDGTLYTGFEDGRIARFAADGSDYRLIADTRGRPLGIALHPSGDLIVADAKKGLLRVTLKGRGTVLATEAEKEPFGFPDDVAVDAAGRFVYFTDASSTWGYGRSTTDVLEHRGSGRLLRYDFTTATTTVLLHGLQFANGVALDPDEQFVLVDETGGYRVTRYWLAGAKAGTSDVFVDDLPGFPDNVRFAGRDRVWVALPSPRDPFVDRLAAWPLVRGMIARAVYWLPPSPARDPKVMAYDREGRLVANMQTTDRHGYGFITQVTEAGQWLYFGSIEEDAIGRLPLAAAGLAAMPLPP
jgi:sugar lactone lactonase YvrE